MAKILVVDDRPLNRNFLVSLLGYYGHTLSEAADGIEALAAVNEHKPDLVISDILMPNMDGEEFMRRLRAGPATKDMPVIFYTANYRVREASTIAARVNVTWVLAKPSEPKAIIETVAKALGTSVPAAQQVASAATAPMRDPGALGKGVSEQLTAVDGLNLRLGKLLEGALAITEERASSPAGARSLEAALQDVHCLSLRLTGLVELGLDLSRTRDQREMIELFCRALQDISSAHYAGVVVLGGEGEPLRQFAARGLDDATRARVAAEIAGCPAAKRVLGEGGAGRMVIGANPPDITGLPASHPPVKTFLACPVAAHDKTIGWLYVADRLGDKSFSTDDEHIVMALAAQLAIAWDGLAMYTGLERLVAERKREKKNIRRMATVVRDSNDAITIQDFKGQITAWNRGAELMYGYSEKEALQMNMGRLTSPGKVEEQKDFTHRLMTGEMVTSFETQRVTKDGRILDVWLTITKLMDDTGKPIGIASTERDITARRQAEHNLVVSERRYRRLFETAKDGILMLDYETGQIVDVNPFLTTMLGFSYEEMMGKTLWDIGFARDVLDSKLNFADLKRQGYVRYEDLPLETKDHRTVFVEFISNMYPVDTQNVIQCNIRDITERKQMERRAARLEELATLGQLMSGIAHEIKNPLFVLSGRLQLVSEKLAAREYDTVGTDFKTIEDAAQRMTTITQRFLNFSTPHTAQKERCAINSLLQRTVDFLSNELTKNHIQLVKSLSSNLQPVWCDCRDLQQIFTNLILNAIYAMVKANGRGTLTILTVPSLETVEIRIQDDGPGIAPEHHARLFDPFFTTKSATEGTGLGLWIVKSLIIGMNGTIDCESEIGKGATFVVRLPTLLAQESS